MSALPYIYNYDDSLWSNSGSNRQILKDFASTKDDGKWNIVLSIATTTELQSIANPEVASELLEEVDGVSLDQTLCDSDSELCLTVCRQLWQTHPALDWFVPAEFFDLLSGTNSKISHSIIPIRAPYSVKDFPEQLSTKTTTFLMGLSSREFCRINTPTPAAEVAFLLELGLSELYQQEAAGWDEKTPLSVYFVASTTPDIFTQAAKMRSVIILWDLIIKELGLDRKVVQTRLMAHSSGGTTERESHKALLSGICESIGSIIGGATHVVTAGTDNSSPEATIRSLRLCRNIQLISRYESKIGDIIDPVGGSWYAENLTRSVMESAWEIFQNSQTQISQNTDSERS